MDNLLQRVRLALADNYEIHAEVGRGGMAVVYVGRDLRHDRLVAVKILPPHLASAVGHERFLQEIKLAAGLSHPYVLPLLDSGKADGLLYYVMPFVEGDSLAERISIEGPMPIPEVLRIAGEMTEALGHAHSLGIIHRDIKPSNILLTHEHAVLTDFGVAFALRADKDERLTGTGVSIGTPAYMSPQQGLGQEELDGSSDQYSLACVIYEMFTGGPPFVGASSDAVFRSHVMDPPPDVRSARPSVPEAAAAALDRALAKVPGDRFPSMEAFGEALRGDPPPPERAASSRRRVSTAVVAGLVIAGGAFGWSALSGRGAGPTALVAPNHLALLPCKAMDPRDSVLARNIANATFQGLQGFPLRVTSYRQSASWAARHVPGVLQTDSLSVALAHLGTSTIVDCTVRPVGSDSVQVSYQLHGRDFHSDSVRLERSSDQWVDPDLFILELVNLLGGGSAASGSAFRPTENVQAAEFYYHADDLFSQDRLIEAEHYFGRAADADPGFALARWRQADARRWWAGPPVENIDIQQLFEESAGRLGTRDSLLVWALIADPGPETFARFDTVLQRLPRDAYATLLYGDELLHRGALWGITLDSIENVLETATRLNPGFASSWDHLAQVQIRLGKEAAAREAVDRLEVLASPASKTNPLPLDLIWRQGWQERFDPAAAEENRSILEQDATLLGVVARLVRYGDLPRAQLELGTALVDHADTDPGDPLWHSGMNAVGLARAGLGWPAASVAAFDSTAHATPAAALFSDQWKVVPAALGLEGFPSDEAAAGRLASVANDSLAVPLHRARAAWALALRASAGGAVDSFEHWRRSVTVLLGNESRLSRHLEALSLAQAGLLDEALAASRVLVTYDSIGNTERPFGRAATYLHRGSWFEQADQPDSAIAAWTWYQNTDLETISPRDVQASEVDGAFGTHARIRIARLAARTQRPDLAAGACAEAGEVVRRWAESEAVLSSLVDEADGILESCPQ